MTLRLVLVALLGALFLSGCDTDQEEAGVDDAAARLDQQRVDVRARANDLVDALGGGLGGRLTQSSGQFRGCDSTFNDQYKNFHYLAQARVDVTSEPSVGAVGGAVQEAGLAEAGTTSVPGGGQRVGFTHGDLSGSVTFYPGQSYVLVDVSGPCVDVPEDQRDDWLRKSEPSPHLR